MPGIPTIPIIARTATTATLPDGTVVHTFGGCDYLALAHHKQVAGAITHAFATLGLSSSASRQTTGNTQPHNALETDLAAFLGVEACLLLPDGYTANIAACQGLATRCPTALLDTKAHVSMRDSAHTAGLTVARFAHQDPASLGRELKAVRPNNALVMTDGVFTADGSLAPLRACLDAIGPDDLLLIDDCHGLGVLGPGGRGSAAHASLKDPRILITSSLAKGLGCAGGFIAGSSELVESCQSATAFVCTTPIAPALAVGTRHALHILIDSPTLVEQLATNALLLRSRLHTLGLCEDPSASHAPFPIPIVAFTIGTTTRMQAIETQMRHEGFLLPLICYPGGPADAYFRLSITAAHSPKEINAMADALACAIKTTRTHTDPLLPLDRCGRLG